MSHHDQDFANLPKKLVIPAGPRPGPADSEEIRLIIKGQGTVSFALDRHAPFAWTVADPADAGRGLRVAIAEDGVAISERDGSGWRVVAANRGADAGLDEDDNCRYWISLDCHNRRIRYGKGEMRLKTTLLAYDFPAAPASGADPYAWVGRVESAEFAPRVEGGIEVWRDPIVTEPPLFVVAPDRIAMEDVARNTATVPANLTPACQVLYGNVAGANFQLNAPDFPHFVDAIEASIRDPEGWCHRTLKAKSGEFGKSDFEETYLRITLGANQGDSPGIPYVMEIWPPGHFSPIHNHGGANAVIRVLSGEITVKLLWMLSTSHQKPFAEQVFRKDDVTWISPGLNQFHQLVNRNEGGPTCITIQCYMYGDQDVTHYEYFDYIADKAIAHFTPNSDMDFLTFKATMIAEWRARQGG